MLGGIFVTAALLNVAHSATVKSEDKAVNTIKAASYSLPVQIFSDSDPSDVTKLIEAKERAQRDISENDVVARFAAEVENPHHIPISDVHGQEFIDNRTAFFKHLQYRTPNCGRPFDVFKLLEVVQDARREEQQRILKVHSIPPECSLRCCPPGPCPPLCSPKPAEPKCSFQPKLQPTTAVPRNKLWNPNASAFKGKTQKEADKDRTVNSVIPSDEPALSRLEPRKKSSMPLFGKQIPNEMVRSKLKFQKLSNDQPVWQRTFQRPQSLESESELVEEDRDKKLSAEFNGAGIDRYYSPEQIRRFPGTLRAKLNVVPRKWNGL